MSSPRITTVVAPWLSDISAAARAQAADAKLDVDKQRHKANKLHTYHTLPPPFDDLHAKGLLDHSRATNNLLHDAGTRYYADWYSSGLNGQSAIDYERIAASMGTDPVWGMPVTEKQAIRRMAFRSAREAIGRFAASVDAIVLEGHSVVTVGLSTGYAHHQARRAAVLERLNTGLRLLAVHYGMMKGNAA